MRFYELNEDGRIVKGVNTTVDVGPNEIPKQAKKFGNSVSKDGVPPTLSKKTKGKSTNVLFNLGLAENISVDTLYENVLYYRQMKEDLGEIAQATEIYIDMDGVLADFFGEWAKLMKVDHFSKIDKEHKIGDALQAIRDKDEFWLNLPLLPQAKQLLSVIKQIKGEYNICSSPLADDPNSEPHKREWIKKNLAFFPPKEVIITSNKPEYATQQDGTPNILIDDYGVNVDAWEAAGGTAFKYKDHKFERTAKAIQQHMQEPVSEGAEITMWTNPEYQGADVDDKYYKKQPVKIVDVSKLTPFEPTDKMDPKDNHDNMMRFVDKIKAGKKLKPIVIVPHEGKLLIVDGHHRYFAHKKAGVDKIRAVIADPKDLTWRDDVPESVKENFADGKKKGKSKPGRVKKAGASCNGSVTSLRKKAKNASGEKAKMYHWCANMKGGRKKKGK